MFASIHMNVHHIHVKRIVRIGRAIALVPLFCVRNELGAGSLHATRIRKRSITQDAGLVCRKDLSLRALSLFRQECICMRGTSPREITLEQNPLSAPFATDPDTRSYVYASSEFRSNK
jgi:hypothetical protein